jgi:hypothetical protein
MESAGVAANPGFGPPRMQATAPSTVSIVKPQKTSRWLDRKRPDSWRWRVGGVVSGVVFRAMHQASERTRGSQTPTSAL